MDKIDEIKVLWKKIPNKTTFIMVFSKEIGRSANTVHNHWFARFWQVPQAKQDDTIKYMEKYIKNKSPQINEIKTNKIRNESCET